MTRANAKDYIKSKMADYLQSTGRPLNKAFSCPNPSHDDAHPSAQYDQKSREKVTCFSRCGQFDIFDLIGFDYGLTGFSDQFNKACELYGIDLEYTDTPNHSRPDPDGHPLELDAEIATGRASNPKGMKEGPEPTPQPEPEPDPKKVKETAAYLARCQSNLDKCDYLQRRGISMETAKKMGLGYDLHFKTKLQGGTEDFIEWQALIIQTGETSCTARNMAGIEEIEALYPGAEKKERYRNRGEVIPFNLDALQNKEKPVFIVEGELDALSIIEAGGQAVGLGGVGQVRDITKHIENLNKGQITQPLIIALDNDKAGNAAADELENELNELADGKELRIYRYNISKGHKDPNEALLADKDGFTLQIEALKDEQAIKQAIEKEALKEAVDRHRMDAVKGKIAGFVDCITKSSNTECYSTGIDRLDYLLDGGLYSGIYYLGAISGLGKTTFVLSIADHVAKCGHDVLYFSLEMGTYELMAKSTSRHTLLRSMDIYNSNIPSKVSCNYARTTREIMTATRREFDEKEMQTISNALEDYHNYAENRIYFYEGVGDIAMCSTISKDPVTGGETRTKGIREIVEDHVKLAKASGALDSRPLVVIDYLQILAPYDRYGTDKQNTDKSVVEIKRMSRDLDIPVICISAFNRDSYNEPVNMASFRESSAIEYGADCLLGLQYEGMDYEPDDRGTNGAKHRAKRLAELREQQEEKAKQDEMQDIELKVLKNRNGIRGRVRLGFMPAYNYYQEKSEGTTRKRKKN